MKLIKEIQEMTNQIINKTKDSCIIYRSFIDATISLPDAERLQIFDAIFSYALDGKEPKLNGVSSTVFTLIRPQLDANRKRFENGCKEKKKSKRKAKGKQRGSKPEANDNVNDNVNPNLNSNLKSELEKLNVNLETWQDFVAFRLEKKKPITDRILKILLKDLKEFEAKKKGFANLSLENSVKNSWQGLFQPKEETHKTLTLTQSSSSYLDYLDGGVK